MTAERFGQVLKEERVRAGRSMGEVAKALKVSTTFVSDVERGVRTPFTAERIMQFSNFLNLPAQRTDRLLQEAAACRGAFELGVQGAYIGEMHMRVGAALMRGWATLEQTELDEIFEIIARRQSPAARRTTSREQPALKMVPEAGEKH